MLQTVGGDFLFFLSSGLESVNAPALHTVAGNLSGGGADGLTALDLSGLQQVNGRVDLADMGTGGTPFPREFPDLASAEAVRIFNCAAFGAVSIPALTNVQTRLEVFDNPNLADVHLSAGATVPEGIYVQGNGVGASSSGMLLVAGATMVGANVQIIGNHAFHTVGVPDIQSIDGMLFLDGNEGLTTIEIPELTNLGVGLKMYQNPVLSAADLGKLNEVEFGVTILENGAAAPSPSQIDLSSLERVVQLSLVFSDNKGFNGLSLDALTTIGESLVVDRNDSINSISAPLLSGTLEVVSINGNPNLVDVDLAAIEVVEDRISFGGNGMEAGTTVPVVFTDLRDVGNVLFFIDNESFGSLEFPALESSGGFDIASNPGLTSVAAPLLAQTAGSLQIRDNPDLAALRLPALLSTAANFDVFNNASLGSVSATVLGSVGGGLNVNDNGSLGSFGMPALGSAGSLGFNNNPSLCASIVDALAAQVGLAMGMYANNGNAACQ